MTNVPQPRRYPELRFSFDEVMWLLDQHVGPAAGEAWEAAMTALLERRVAVVEVPEPSSRRVQQLEGQIEALRVRALKAEAMVEQLAAKLAKVKAS